MSREHGHEHVPASPNRAFAVGAALNLTFVVVEATYGAVAGSVALLADAAHNASDVLGLLLAWGAVHLARRRPTPRRTYGFRKATVLSALANGVLLLIAVGGVAWEAVRRLFDPQPVAAVTIISVAAVGVAINTFSALLFARGSKGDLNVRGAFIHLAADAAVSAAVVVSGILLHYTHATWLDPAVSLAISAAILVSTWRLLESATNLTLDAVPAHVEHDRVRAYLLNLSGVTSIHDLHIWALSTTEVALTAHLVVDDASSVPSSFLREVAAELHKRFAIEHTTLQVEPANEDERCRREHDGAV